MLQTLFIFLLFVAVMAVTAILFTVWVIALIVRAIVRAARGPTATAQRLDRVGPSICCPHASCHATNPAAASFCRRCGRPVRAALGPPPMIVGQTPRRVVRARPVNERPP
ncbi:MAG TPA: hypothetical protein VK324_14520, partial [Tepidisphaeraceae bacterium]|nr:hypothetical protein [Tepidisphaeraceae bacterium]